MSPYDKKSSDVDQVDNAQYKSLSQIQDGAKSQEESNADILASPTKNKALGQENCRSSKEIPLIQDENQNKVQDQRVYDNDKRDIKSLDLESNGTFTKRQDSGESEPAASLDTNSCVFCLDGGELIHMCSCSVLTHKECALEYIRFLGNINENCPQCRGKLEYDVLDKKTPMRDRHVIAFVLLIIVYLTIIGLSFYYTILLIPQGDKNFYVWLAIVGNVGILWPLIIVFIFTLILACYSAYRYRNSGSNPIICGGCDGCSGGCGDCGSCDGGGEGCGMILCVICLLVIFAVLIAASTYLLFSLYKFYKSLSLKSKKEILFQHEGRQINTLGKNHITV